MYNLIGFDTEDIGLYEIENLGNIMQKTTLEWIEVLKKGGWSIINVGKKTFADITEVIIEKNGVISTIRHYQAFGRFKNKLVVVKDD